MRAVLTMRNVLMLPSTLASSMHVRPASTTLCPAQPLPLMVPPPTPSFATLGTISWGNSAFSQYPAIMGATSVSCKAAGCEIQWTLSYSNLSDASLAETDLLSGLEAAGKGYMPGQRGMYVCDRELSGGMSADVLIHTATGTHIWQHHLMQHVCFKHQVAQEGIA